MDETLENAGDAVEFARIMGNSTDRELLEFVAYEVFTLKRQVGAFLPQMEALASGPLGGMLGGLFR